MVLFEKSYKKIKSFLNKIKTFFLRLQWRYCSLDKNGVMYDGSEQEKRRFQLKLSLKELKKELKNKT